VRDGSAEAVCVVLAGLRMGKSAIVSAMREVDAMVLNCLAASK
jgi:hypothetical protein